MHTCMYTYIHAFIFQLCPFRGPRNNDSPVATSSPKAQILDLNKHHPAAKGTKAPGAGKAQMPEIFVPEIEEMLKVGARNDEDMSKRHSIHLEGAPNSQIWDNLIIKMNNNINGYSLLN